jgi:tetratricopeptide (TPR) repeat protein
MGFAARAFSIPSLLIAASLPAAGASMDRWVEARSTHFIVLTDASEKQARRLAGQFERIHLVFHTLLPMAEDDGAAPVRVLAVKDSRAMQALEPEAYLGKGRMELAGLFLRVPDTSYILLRLDAQQQHAYATVYHEYTHSMLRKAEHWLPLWLNEGLAQFYEDTDIDGRTAWLGEADAEKLQLLARNDLLPIETLLKIDARSDYYHDEDKGSIFYAESWALTHFLIVSDRIQGTHRLHDYTERVAGGEDAVAAAREVFGDLAKLQAGLSDYTMQRKFLYFMMPVELSTQDATVEVRGVTAAQADAVRADLMAYTGRVAEARDLDQTVLRDEPSNALAHETMGVLLYRDGDVDGARQWFEQAVALDGNSYRGHYYAGMLAMHAGAKGGDSAIESELKAAIRLNAQFAPAYDALDEAHELNLRAIAIEPGRLNYRLNCAEVLAQQRRFADSLGVLQEAMRLARSPDEVQAVASRMTWVERSQMAAASVAAAAGASAGSGQ